MHSTAETVEATTQRRFEQAKQLTSPDYSPFYREWPWYTEPKRQRRAVWSEPFMDDQGGANIPMLTYAVPLERQGEFVGVVSVDLPLDRFRVLQDWLKRSREGRQGYVFVVNPTGTFVSPPKPEYRLGKSAEMPGFHTDEILKALTNARSEN